MDITTIGGLIGAIISLCVGDFLEGGNPLHLIHISSLIIIIPTAMCAASSATHATHIKGAMKELKIVFGSTGVNLNEIIRQLVELATLARKDGVLALEGKAAQIEDDFLRQSLSMIIDGRDAHAVREDMEVQIESLEEYYKGCSHFWILYAETCPTMGLVGAVMGLMQERNGLFHMQTSSHFYWHSLLRYGRFHLQAMRILNCLKPSLLKFLILRLPLHSILTKMMLMILKQKMKVGQ